MRKPVILIVDDEPDIQRSLSIALENAGFAVKTAADGVDCLDKIASRRPDLILLDVQMPRMDGFETCEEIRKIDKFVPIVFHSVLSSPGNITAALGRLADSYVLKHEPNSVKIAKIKAVLRRYDQMRAANGFAMTDDEIIAFGDVRVNVKEAILQSGRKRQALTPAELSILRYLYSMRGRFCTNDEIFAAMYGEKSFKGDERTLRSHISHLNIKLGRSRKWIINARRVGYKLLAE